MSAAQPYPGAVRQSTVQGQLARRGFVDVTRAVATIEKLGIGGLLLDMIAASADPDAALHCVAGLAERGSLARLVADHRLAKAVVVVAGASDPLGAYLSVHPEDLDVLLTGVDFSAVETAPDGDALRRAYRRGLLGIAAADLTMSDRRSAYETTSRALADLADAVLRGAHAIAARDEPIDHRLGIVALGKCGAQELNYVSDVDVVFVAEPVPGADPARALETATRVAAATMRLCSAHTAAGTIWPVDANLRPEGKAGPLVRTLASCDAYYARHAAAWELQAMLRARPVAGDLNLAAEFCAMVAPRVWRVGDVPGFVADTQAMRRRVVALLPADQARREIKLGEGGLRDVEFAVQLLQLIHGRIDERVRATSTLGALDQLVAYGYVGRSDGAALAEAYVTLRTLEHRAQLLQLRRTHLVPHQPAAQRRLARGIGVEDVTELWRTTAREVQRLHQRMFYSPLLATVASIPSGEVVLTSEAAHARLTALGFADPAVAMYHIEALTSGLTRKAEIQRTLLPAMLTWLADGPLPDAGLLAFRRVSEALGDSPWYLRALRDEGVMAARLASVLAASRLATDLLLRDPSVVALLADNDELRPRRRELLVAEMERVAARQESVDAAVSAVRAIRRRELWRIAVADLTGLASLSEVGEGLSDLACASIDAALGVVVAATDGCPPVGVVAMGRWGGRELGYGSDADCLFVIADSDADAIPAATRALTWLRALLSAPGPEPALELDCDLRPEGKSGPLVRTVESYLAYYQRWAEIWEAQALLRASYGAGEAAPVEALLAGVAQRRYPSEGLTASALAQIRRLQVRIEAERLPRGTDPTRNLKLGPGGLVDVEWTAQVAQLQHAGEYPELRTTSTLIALREAARLGLLGVDAVNDLIAAWELATRVRNCITLLRGRSVDVLPGDASELAAVARLLGYERGQTSAFLDDLRRTMRRARAASM